MHMVWHQMSFFDLAFLAPGKLVKDSAEVPPDLPKQQLLAVLRREHDMVHALPCRVVQMIMILWHCDLLEDPRGSSEEIVVILRPSSRSCRTASIRSGIAGGLAGELSSNAGLLHGLSAAERTARH